MEALLERTESLRTESEKNSLEKYLKNSFVHFFFLAFSVAVRRVEGKYIIPPHLKMICARLQFHNRTSTVAPRYHLKSTVVEGYVAWKLYQMARYWNEWNYMSYTSDLGAYHTKRLKRYIEALPELFGDYRSLTPAESILHYEKEGRQFVCEPEGITSFKRGKHPHGLICDDILKDPQVKLDISQLEKIKDIFFTEVEQMPTEELHLVGTPQDQEDLFAVLETKPDYDCKRYLAEVDPANQIPLWKEKFNWEELQRRKALIGEKAYMKEFMCMPVRSGESFFTLLTLNKVINNRLKNHDVIRPIRLNEWSYGGFDIGKKSHPSHLAVFGVNRKKKLVQIHSKWMDGWDYIRQVDYCRQAIKNFKIARLEYDNTRAEFEGFREAGDLPAEMAGVEFTSKNKFAMATAFDRLLTQGNIQLLNDPRQKRQLLNVDNDLQALETEEGHGDCFFSICLAIKAFMKGRRQMVYEL